MEADLEKPAWCATFAALYAFETRQDHRTSLRVASLAYARRGALTPVDAVGAALHGVITWPARLAEQRERLATSGY